LQLFLDRLSSWISGTVWESQGLEGGHAPALVFAKLVFLKGQPASSKGKNYAQNNLTSPKVSDPVRRFGVHSDLLAVGEATGCQNNCRHNT